MSREDKKSHITYDIYPKIILGDTQRCINVKPVGSPPFVTGGKYIAVIFAREDNFRKTYTINPKDGILTVSHFFSGEQEHLIHIYRDEVTDTNEECILHVYSLKKDLYNKKPYKGDFHIHSTHSDGHETPEAICALARKSGIDFMSITDHRKYQPSVKARSAFEGIGSDLVIYTGEEVHFHGRQHIISYGAREALGEKYEGNELFDHELNEFMLKTKDEMDALPDDVDKHSYAALRLTIEKIRCVGGLSIVAHPHWIVDDGYHNAGKLFKFMYENKKFDVFEVRNGCIGEEPNNLQSEFYNQQRAKGNDLPIVSGTDAHTVIFNEQFGKLYTVVFTEDLEFVTLRNNVLDGYTAVIDETLPYAFGQFRLVKYARYLLREIFPLHDDICHEEGRLMYRYTAGDDDAVQKLKNHKGAVKSLYDKLWG